MLAIDYGTKYTGLAVYKEGLISSRPAIPSKHPLFLEKLTDLVAVNEIEKIILGYAPPPDGRISKVHHEIKQLEKTLKEKLPKLEVYLVDESGTSNEAIMRVNETKTGINRGKKKKKNDLKIHSVAACLILERYLATI
jgi:putative transcription antitermination factor YqgF